MEINFPTAIEVPKPSPLPLPPHNTVFVSARCMNEPPIISISDSEDDMPSPSLAQDLASLPPAGKEISVVPTRFVKNRVKHIVVDIEVYLQSKFLE